MSEWSQFIIAVATLVSSISALVMSIHNATKIEEVHLATNSMKDELVASTAKAPKAEGVKEERERGV